MITKRALVRLLLPCMFGLFLPGLGIWLKMHAKDGVSVSAINYTGHDLNAYLFKNPETGEVAGGPGLNPYEGGGTMCCYTLPRKWHEGIKVSLRYDWWTGSSDVRDYQYVTVELPRYPTDEPGMLWALFNEDGSVEVIASAVDPGHPKWPGKIKHWPVPSREYKLKLWQMDYDELLAGIKLLESPLDTDTESLQHHWDTYQHLLRTLSDDEQKIIQGLSGPSDPKFLDFLRQDRKKSLANDRLRAEYMLKQRP